MDRFVAMLVLLGCLVSTVLFFMSLFAVAPIICSCLLSLLYSLYLFIAYEESGVHHAQEFENRFWTVFACLLAAALFFARDSPLAFGIANPSWGVFGVILSGYAMHLWDRHVHRLAISKAGFLRRSSGGAATSQSLLRLQDLGIEVAAQLEKINECLTQIDQLLIPSTINNLINLRYIQSKEREIIKVFEDCDARALNYLISNVKLGLLFYKIKDHRNFNGKNRTDLINLLAYERLQILTVMSRVILLHSLQLMKLRANPRAEHWVQNILLNTHQDDLSELKTLMDAKGDYFSMTKLIYDDIRSESTRQTILSHIRREATVQQTYKQMGTRRKNRVQMQWRKVLSDVDDTLCSSGGMYPAGIDKRYARKTVYPGVLAFYRELDLGTDGPEEWDDDQVGNLVFLSARPHLYRDVSEKQNFAKFQLLRADKIDGRKGLHTMPSLLAGDISSGSQYMMTNDFEPLAKKKLDNFERYVSIYPEFKHVFVCDNGQGDVRAAELMSDTFPYEFEGAYVHVVQDVNKTYGYAPDRWREKEFKPFFFRTYPEAALHAASQNPPLIRTRGLQRICQEAVKDFQQIKQRAFSSSLAYEDRRLELNQAIWQANFLLRQRLEEPVDLVFAGQKWKKGQRVSSPFGIATIEGFDPVNNLYDVVLDWRPLNVQVKEYTEQKTEKVSSEAPASSSSLTPRALETVVETEEETGLEIDSNSDETSQELRGGEASSEAEEDVSTLPKQEVGQSSAESSSERREPFSTTAESPAVVFTSQRSTQESSHDILTESSQLGSLPTPIAEPSTEGNPDKPSRVRLGPRAQLSGRVLKKFVPPALPVLDSKRKTASMFPFLTTSPESKQVSFKAGEEVITPYGLAIVKAYREKQRIVVVEMVGWHGTGYFREECLKRVSKSVLKSLLKQLSGEPSQKAEFPYVQGTSLQTPFGLAKVSRPLPLPAKGTKALSSTATIGLSLVNWKLANGENPVIYCTVASALEWRNRKDPSSLFSTLNTLVSSSRTLLEPFLAQKKPALEDKKTYKRYYKDGAAVTSKYGPGRVSRFRDSDGIYEVDLIRWNLANASHPKAYLRQDDIMYRIAPGCQEGHPVLTTMGLSGTLASVEPTTGVHLVTINSAGMVCYLQPDSILRPLKAAVGEEVTTSYGEGRVKAFDTTRDVYTIDLVWGAKLYAFADTFDRIGDGIQVRDGSFGVDWLFRFLFFRSESVSRSRSNSVTSASQSVRSVTTT